VNVGKRKQIVNVNKKTKEKKMKVSKIILTSLLGAVVLGAASADEYDGPRNRCKSKSDKYWVEKTHECVPTNTCKADKDIRSSYCIRVFADVETPDMVGAVRLSEEYLKIKGFTGVDCSFDHNGKEHNLFGQDYISCITSGGGYYVFEFDDTENSEFIEFNEDGRERHEVGSILCKALGGQMFGDDACSNINEAQCDKWLDALHRVYTETTPRYDEHGLSLDGYDAGSSRCIAHMLEFSNAKWYE
jgi:hypothetical protein